MFGVSTKMWEVLTEIFEISTEMFQISNKSFKIWIGLFAISTEMFDISNIFGGHLSTYRVEKEPRSGPFKAKNNSETTFETTSKQL